MKKKLLVALLAATAAVCGAFGLSACGDKPEGGNGGEKHTHDYGTEWIPDKDYHWHECKNDGCDEKIIDKAAHKDDNGDGKCDICKYQIGEVVAGEHKLTPVAETKATCTTKGNIAYYICSDCGKWFSDKDGQNEITDKLSVITSYELTPIARIEATCDKDGNKAYYICGDCGKWYSDKEGKNEIKDKTSVILPKGHKLTPVAETTETCTTDGNTAYYTCGGCDKWFEDANGEHEITDKSSVVISKTGHKLAPHEEIPATCTEDGQSAYYTCDTCKKWYSDKDGENEITDKSSVILPKGHKLTPVPAKAETCTEDGNNEYYICDACGRWFWDKNCQNNVYDKTDVVIEKGHKYVNGICQACKQPQPFTQGLTYTYIANGYEVSGIGTATDKDIIIPSTYKGVAVTSIGDNAFSQSEIQFISIPDSVISIGSSAFYLTRLTEIIIPDSVRTIGDSAFLNCKKLVSITIGKGIKELGRSVFTGCNNLINITIPKGITNIGDMAFSSCSNLTSVTIPEGVTSIGMNAFDGCSALQTVNIPDSVTSIGSMAFFRCDKIIQTENGVQYVDKWAIGVESSIEEVTLRSDTKGIADRAFTFRSSIINISIPESVISIGVVAFGACSSLEDIYFNGTQKQWEAIEKGRNWDESAGAYIVHCKDGDIAKS